MIFISKIYDEKIGWKHVNFDTGWKRLKVVESDIKNSCLQPIWIDIQAITCMVERLKANFDIFHYYIVLFSSVCGIFSSLVKECILF